MYPISRQRVSPEAVHEGTQTMGRAHLEPGGFWSLRLARTGTVTLTESASHEDGAWAIASWSSRASTFIKQG